ncbi:MAG TPA: universal stress protein [Bacteroidales bacterium]|nr:universal stress protein [Bacteroidales bacterium]
MRETLLIPTDFSIVARYSMDHAVNLARQFNRKIVLLHVVGKKVLGTPKEVALGAKMREAAAWIKKKGDVEVSWVLEEGNIFTTIADVADRIKAEFIVIGIHGKKGVQHIMGSYAYKVVCSSRVPVLLVKKLHRHVGYKNIVLPIDFSAESTQKILKSIKFSHYFGANIKVFGFLGTHNPAKLISKQALLKKVKDIYAELGLTVTTDLCVDPSLDWPEALMKFSERTEADLIMIVAEKDGGIPDIFGQNSTETLIDKAEIPILTVMPSLEEESPELESVVRAFIDPMGITNGRVTSKYFIG